MIVRKKRNADASETVYLEDSSLTSTSTNIPILNNMTSIHVAMNSLFNSSLPYIGQKESNDTESYTTNESYTTYPVQWKLKTSSTTEDMMRQGTTLEVDIINETITDDTSLEGDGNIPENLVWGIDNTVITINSTLQLNQFVMSANK